MATSSPSELSLTRHHRQLAQSLIKLIDLASKSRPVMTLPRGPRLDTFLKLCAAISRGRARRTSRAERSASASDPI